MVSFPVCSLWRHIAFSFCWEEMHGSFSRDRMISHCLSLTNLVMDSLDVGLTLAGEFEENVVIANRRRLIIGAIYNIK